MTGNAGCIGLLLNLGRPQLADLLLVSCLGAAWVKSSSAFHIDFFFFCFMLHSYNKSVTGLRVLYILWTVSCGLSLIWKAMLLQSRFHPTPAHTRAVLGSGIVPAFQSL